MVLLEQLRDLANKLLPLLNRGISPCGEGLLSGSNGVVQVLLGCNRDIPKLLASGRVDATMDLVGAALLAVDDVVELLEIESRDL